MKLSQLVTRLTLAVAVTGYFMACQKDKEVQRKPFCRIIAVTPLYASTGLFNMTYNSEGRLKTISSGSDVITSIAYNGNTAIATTHASESFNSRKIITFNPDGLAVNVKTEYDTAGADWNNEAYEYNGTQLSKAITTSSSGATPLIYTLTWQDGNLLSIDFGSSTTTFDYYPDQPSQPGDYLYLAQLVQGYQIYKTKNLVKAILNGPDRTNFDYGFDRNNYINTITATGSSAVTYTYQYQCN